MIAFELLVGPYAVAHLRLSQALGELDPDRPARAPVQVYLADTLESPNETVQLPLTGMAEVVAAEHEAARRVKAERRVMVCLGNPPYQRAIREPDDPGELSGGWVRHSERAPDGSPISTPIFEDFVGPARRNTRFSHLRSLYNAYVYFWRWALWKVFEQPIEEGQPNEQPGIVSFITASSYLSGPGFLGMREHMRRVCDDLWIIDLGGEGTGVKRDANVFAIQRPVAICFALRHGASDPDTPARVRYVRLEGTREEKLAGLGGIHSLAAPQWLDCPSGWHDPFRPARVGAWVTHPRVTDLFPWSQPGVIAARTWPVAPDPDTLRLRWDRLAAAPGAERGMLFHEARHGRRTTTVPQRGLPTPASTERIFDVTPASPRPRVVRHAFRSFDRQWLLADARLLRTPSQPLWYVLSPRQVFLVSKLTEPIGDGPASVATAFVPDYHCFRGHTGGKDIIPLYRDPDGTQANVTSGLLAYLSDTLGIAVTAEDLFTYTHTMMAAPRYTERFSADLTRPSPRVPITADPELFSRVAALGRGLIRLHTFGERMADLGGEGGLAPGRARWQVGVPPTPDGFPREVTYHRETETVAIGSEALVSPISEAVWAYEVSGLHVLRSWLRYRMREPAGRAASGTPLDEIRPAAWPSDWTAELLEPAWTLEALVDLEEEQAELVDAVIDGDTLPADDFPKPTAAEVKPPRVVFPQQDPLS